MFIHLSSMLLLVVSIGLWLLMAFAFIDAAIRPSAAYAAAGKRSKLLWTLIIGIALAVSLATLSAIGIFGLVGIVAALVYILDVRPAVRSVSGGGSSSSGSSYGSW